MRVLMSAIGQKKAMSSLMEVTSIFCCISLRRECLQSISSMIIIYNIIIYIYII